MHTLFAAVIAVALLGRVAEAATVPTPEPARGTASENGLTPAHETFVLKYDRLDIPLSR